MMRVLTGIVAALLVAACGNNERSFDLPLAELKQRVGEVEISPIMLQSRGVGTDRVVGDDRISWKVLFEGEEVFRLVAALAATSDTRSSFALTLEPGERMKARLATNPSGIESIRELYLVAQEEQILAHLERRSPDMTRVMAATVRATMANQEQIFGSADRATQRSAQSQSSDDAT